jgi:hypothetical protein
MCKTKGFIIGALLTLILIPALACSAEPAQAPASPPPITEPAPVPETTPQLPEETPPSPSPTPPELEIPANFTTYTDESNYFSISYPQDWQTATTDQNSKEVISNLKSGVPIKGASTIFSAGRPTATEYEPSVSIIVEPIHEGTSTLDGIVDAEVQAARSVIHDYQVLSTVKTTIDGREATIIDADGTIPGEGRYFLSMITLVDKTIWVVGCSANVDDFAKWEKDFNTIVRSLKIYD